MSVTLPIAEEKVLSQMPFVQSMIQDRNVYSLTPAPTIVAMVLEGLLHATKKDHKSSLSSSSSTISSSLRDMPPQVAPSISPPTASDWKLICSSLFDRIEPTLQPAIIGSPQYQQFCELCNATRQSSPPTNAPAPKNLPPQPAKTNKLMLGKLFTLYVADAAGQKWYHFWPQHDETDILDKALNSKVQVFLTTYPALDPSLSNACLKALRRVQLSTD